MWEEQKKRDEAMKLEWKQRQADKLDDQPYVAEITLVEQTILFCKGLVPFKEKEQKSEEKQTVFDNPDNTEVLLKKEDRDEYYFVPTKQKKGKSKQKTGKSEAGGNKPIKHNAETFRLFDQLKLDAPITTGDIPGTLEKLEEKLEMYKLKVKDCEEKREEKKRRILEGTYDPAEDAEEEKEEAKQEDKEEDEKEEEEEEEEEAKDKEE